MLSLQNLKLPEPRDGGIEDIRALKKALENFFNSTLQAPDALSVLGEQGNWTPVDSSGAGLTLTVTYATHIRLGRLVIAQCQVTYPVTANGSNAIIGGLKYNCANQSVGLLNSTSATPNAVAVTNKSLSFATGHGGGVTNAQMSGATAAIVAIYQI